MCDAWLCARVCGGVERWWRWEGGACGATALLVLDELDRRRETSAPFSVAASSFPLLEPAREHALRSRARSVGRDSERRGIARGRRGVVWAGGMGRARTLVTMKIFRTQGRCIDTERSECLRVSMSRKRCMFMPPSPELTSPARRVAEGVVGEDGRDAVLGSDGNTAMMCGWREKQQRTKEVCSSHVTGCTSSRSARTPRGSAASPTGTRRRRARRRRGGH